MSFISLPDVWEMRCFCVVSFSGPRNNGSKEGNCGRKQTKGFSDFDILVPSLIFIANKQGLPDCTF